MNHAAIEALRDLTWRVNYLVDRDGKTPCRTHMFLFRNDEIILNLYHSEVNKMLQLSKRATALAGHMATALCLSDKRNVLPHLSVDTREDLLTLDCYVARR